MNKKHLKKLVTELAKGKINKKDFEKLIKPNKTKTKLKKEDKKSHKIT